MKNFVLFFLFFISIKAFSQTENQEYVGFISLKGLKQQINYKLVFTEKDGIIEGFSYSDIGKENETKAKIKGKIQKDNIEFSEIEIVYSNQNATEFCLLKAKGHLKKVNDTYSIKAKFTGNLSSNSSKKCGSGEILLMKKDDLLQQLEKSKILEKIDSINSFQSEHGDGVFDNNLDKQLLKKPVQIVSKDKVYEFYTKDNSVDFFVYDHNEIDGDRLTIKENGNLILENELLTADKKKYTIAVKDGSVDIELHSTSDGYLPPNTSMILLEDTQRTQDYRLELEINQRAIIRIIKIN